MAFPYGVGCRGYRRQRKRPIYRMLVIAFVSRGGGRLVVRCLFMRRVALSLHLALQIVGGLLRVERPANEVNVGIGNRGGFGDDDVDGRFSNCLQGRS